MRKFFQWGLVVIVAVALMGVVVQQMLTASTGRARDVSVVALKEKLARLSAEPGAVGTAAALIPPPEIEHAENSRSDEFEPDAGIDALRAQWLMLFEKISELIDACEISKETWRSATMRALDREKPELSEEEREEVLEFQACLAPFKKDFLALRDQHEDLGALFNLEYTRNHRVVLEGLWRCTWLLRNDLWIGAALADYPGTVDTFTSLVYLMKYDDSSLIPFWRVGETTSWILLRPAIERGAVDDARWDRLLGLLEAHRDQAFFFGQVQRQTSDMLYGFEHWKTVYRDLKFSEEPVTFLRTWAYPRITPALFNHDFDRFNRAMNELLEFARVPYFEAKPALEQFCEDFDVEPRLEEIKFTRSNPGWYYVLYLSREGLEANARRQASADLIRMAILLERHRRDTGAYPESLDVLAAQLGGRVPLNPLMGDPYVYTREEDSFQLGYSHEQIPSLVEEFGLDPTAVIYWHDPLDFGLQEDDASEE